MRWWGRIHPGNRAIIAIIAFGIVLSAVIGVFFPTVKPCTVVAPTAGESSLFVTCGDRAFTIPATEVP